MLRRVTKTLFSSLRYNNVPLLVTQRPLLFYQAEQKYSSYKIPSSIKLTSKRAILSNQYPCTIIKRAKMTDTTGDNKYQTVLVKIDPHGPMPDKDFEVPVKLLQQGQAIAMPTETVYGLAADATSQDAVKKIFEAKNRPSDNPLIVHVSSVDMLKTFVDEIPPTAQLLMEKFWPGPLTLLFKSSGKICPAVLAGQPTVAVRQPSHPVAQKLIELSGLPLAAPSANRSGRPSPTTAAHVMGDLNGRIPCVIDGGDCHVGVESTVVDVHRNPPLILRPGGVTLEQLRVLVPSMEVYSKVVTGEDLALKPPTPGLKYKHYSPDAQVILFEGPSPSLTVKLVEQLNDLLNTQQRRVGYIHTRPKSVHVPEDLLSHRLLTVHLLGSEEDLGAIARGLFKSLRDLDELGVEVILVEGIGEEHEGLAVMNRIRKAASHIITTE